MALDKFHYYDGLYYEKFIEPRFEEIRAAVVQEIPQGSRVLDIGCGTGALAFELAHKGIQVTGVDLSQRMITHAQRRKERTVEERVSFIHGDASKIAEQQQYNYAVISMALHEMDPELRIRVVQRAKELAEKVILADYNSPLPYTLAGIRVRLGELFSGMEHFKGFLSYHEKGGLDSIVVQSGLTILKEIINPRETLRIVVVQ